MATLNRHSGTSVIDLDAVWQSIEVILTTSLGSLVEARDFGSALPRLVDRSVSPLTLIEFYAAVPGAIGRLNPESLMAEEPRFRIVQMKLASASSQGAYVFELAGVYYPKGHLGDFSIMQDVNTTMVLPTSQVWSMSQ